MIYLANAFSLSMLDVVDEVEIRVLPLTIHDVRKMTAPGFDSAIGHESTARILSGLLGFEIEARRISVKIDKESPVIVAQYKGPRLEEGATTLPAGASFDFFLCEIC